MKVLYVHKSDPNKEKLYDSVKSLKNNPFIDMSQEEWEKKELESFREEKENGNILSYEIKEENEEEFDLD